MIWFVFLPATIDAACYYTQGGLAGPLVTWFDGQGVHDANALAVILGSLQQESSLDPQACEAYGGHCDDIMSCPTQDRGNGYTATGIGLLQWSYTRRDNLKNWCTQNGKNCNAASTQLDFMLTEPDWPAAKSCFTASGKPMGSAWDFSGATAGSYWECAAKWIRWDHAGPRATYATQFVGNIQCGGTAPGSGVADWATCYTGSTCASAGFACCVATADVATGKQTCRNLGCAAPPTSTKIADWATCITGDVCASPGFVCCVATADASTGKKTCRSSDCAAPPTSTKIADWTACNTGDVCSSAGFVCCVATADTATGKKTCRNVDCLSQSVVSASRIADWASCTTGDICVSADFQCCVATADVATGKKTCRKGDCAIATAGVADWNTCLGPGTCKSSNFVCCVGTADQATGKMTCRSGDCAPTLPVSNGVANWAACLPSQTCSDATYKCCVAPADMATGKTTCRLNDCAVVDTGGTVVDWATCNLGDKCKSVGFTCCIGTQDVAVGKYTCRLGDCSSGTPTPTPTGGSVSSNWVGVNSFFLHTFTDAARQAHLQALQAGGIKVVRLFISSIGAGAKGAPARQTNDLESKHVGQYEDDVLDKIDKLMSEVVKYGIKLDISFHDRYALGAWGSDGYVADFDFTYHGDGNCNNNCARFYTDATIQSKFDNRLIHILTHKNPYMQNRPLGEISEALFTVAPQNEEQGHQKEFTNTDWGWCCRRAKAMKPYLKGVLISCNGADPEDSLQPAILQCPEIDVIGVHYYASGYNAGYNTALSSVQACKRYGKRCIMEEYGTEAKGGRQWQADDIAAQTKGILDNAMPAMVWEFMQNTDSSYEFYTSDPAWSSIKAANARALAQQGAFSWPELFPAAPKPLTLASAVGSAWQLCNTSFAEPCLSSLQCCATASDSTTTCRNYDCLGATTVTTCPSVNSQAQCRSAFGYCGFDSNYCGLGCQSGPCLGAAVVAMPNAPPAGARSMGCAKDANNSRVFETKLGESFALTPFMCIRQALALGYSFVGLEFGVECWASRARPVIGTLAADSNCWIPCSGDRSQKCGAGWRLSTFDLTNVPLGGLSNRDLSVDMLGVPPRTEYMAYAVSPPQAGDTNTTTKMLTSPAAKHGGAYCAAGTAAVLVVLLHCARVT